MVVNHRNQQVSRQGFQEALKGLDRTADRLLRSNQRCLVPNAKGETHDAMRNCHIVAEGFLGEITDSRGQVLCWPASTRSIGRLAQRATDEGKFQSNPFRILVDKYPPVLRSKNHKDCTFTFDCNFHDDRVFKPIDTVKEFQLDDPKTRFLLGFHMVAAYNAWYQGFKQWAKHDFKKDQTDLSISRVIGPGMCCCPANMSPFLKSENVTSVNRRRSGLPPGPRPWPAPWR